MQPGLRIDESLAVRRRWNKQSAIHFSAGRRSQAGVVAGWDAVGDGDVGEGPPQLGLIDVGGGAPEVFDSDSGLHMSLPTDWSRDGRFIAMDDGLGEEQQDTWMWRAAK